MEANDDNKPKMLHMTTKELAGIKCVAPHSTRESIVTKGAPPPPTFEQAKDILFALSNIFLHHVSLGLKMTVFSNSTTLLKVL